MWIIIGLVALAQMTLLPGLLLVRAFDHRSMNVAERAACVFALSLIANAILVPTLVTLHIYNAPVIWTVVLVEGLLLLKAWSPAGQRRSRGPLNLQYLRALGFTTTLGGLLVWASTFVYTCLLASNWGSVFNANDDVANWNRWATEWPRALILPLPLSTLNFCLRTGL
ncbi:MAG TPA: hypothetical protein VFL57_12525 [Bryobacteraceae bacterium]|nr:hypothetical protein [Bryobacteraceae bacterium]